MPPERFSIAQVTPYPWDQPHEVNTFVRRLSDELADRGHRVTIVAPSDSRTLVRESRAVVKALRLGSRRRLAEGGACAAGARGGPVAALPATRRASTVSLPLDVSRTIETLFENAAFDFVHVHEPFAPSASSAALRHSRALNIGTFHSATERVLSTQVARRVVELFFGRLDGRSASFGATRDLVARYFPGDYRVIVPGAETVEREREEGPRRHARDRLRHR